MLSRSVNCVRVVRSLSVGLRTVLPLVRSSSSPFSTTPSSLNDTPWYLNPNESPAISSPLNTIEIPEMPPNYPLTLENLTHFLANDLGIYDLLIFDMRSNSISNSISNSENISSEIEGAHDIADFMILGTGKSSKHLLKASSELQFYIKHNLHKLPLTEGILKTGKLAKYHRKLNKKGKTAPNYSKQTYGVTPNTWVMTDTKTDGIIIHMLTHDRRNDLNLEYLWSNKLDKSKYLKKNNSFNNDDNIFRGIRYFHTSSRNYSDTTPTFNQFDLTSDNYNNHFRKLLKLHLIDHENFPLSHISEFLDKIYKAGFTLNYQSLSSYFETILQSTEFHQNINIKNNTDNFKYQNKFLLHILENYRINLTKDEIINFLPLLIISCSNFTNNSFLTLNKILNTFNIQQENLFTHSNLLNSLDNLSNQLCNFKLNDERLIKHKIDLLLLTIYANRNNWIHFFKVLDNAINRNDLSIINAALPFISICGDGVICSKFENDYYPLIENSSNIEIKESLQRFSELLYEKTHNI